MKFSTWIGDDSFGNIVDIKLIDCKRCTSLTPLGQLPFLKHLHISKFDSVVSVGSEFYGWNSSSSSYGRKPFSALETLRFSNMSSWEQWHSMQTEDDATTYGKLEKLDIFGCPKLIGHLPRCFPSLKVLMILAHKQCALKIPRLPCVREMRICNLEDTESLQEATKLESLFLKDCGESFRSLHMDLLSNLKVVSINGCDYFESLSGQCHQELTPLSLYNCSSFVSFPNGGLAAPKLITIVLMVCPKIKWLPEKMSSLSSLKSLTINSCPLIETIPQGGMPISLSALKISHHQLLRMKWNWQALPHLSFLSIYDNEEDMKSFPEEGLLPPTITSLEIKCFSKLSGLDKNGLTQLTSLQTLKIWNCPELQTLSEEGFPTSLRSFEMYNCPLLKKTYGQKESHSNKFSYKISHIPNVVFHCD